MIRFSILGFPTVVDWWFFLPCVLLGGGWSARDADDWAIVGLWTAVVFVSIMVHELGHGLAGKKYGARPRILLHGFGGTTFLPGGNFTRPQSIIVSAAGPIASLLLGAVILGLNQVLHDKPRLLRIAMEDGLYIAAWWTILNLLPIQPLDGGQILRDVLGPALRTVAAVVGGVVALAAAYWMFRGGQPIMVFMFLMLAYHNFTQQPMQGGVET